MVVHLADGTSYQQPIRRPLATTSSVVPGTDEAGRAKGLITCEFRGYIADLVNQSTRPGKSGYLDGTFIMKLQVEDKKLAKVEIKNLDGTSRWSSAPKAPEMLLGVTAYPKIYKLINEKPGLLHFPVSGRKTFYLYAAQNIKKIGDNSHRYRPLGLGYANLGAVLMSLGLPYDSEQGRAVAAAITALMGGHAYFTSAIIAETKKPFEGFANNQEPFQEVMRLHIDGLKQDIFGFLPENLTGVFAAAEQSWHAAYELGQKHGYRNAQATVLAPTGTIGFMMDCDTTGVEPDIALVKYKKLVGGGMMKMVNNTVPRALKNLGYNESECLKILAYIEERDTIEGAPLLKPEHIAVFDCAFKPHNGVRTIQPMGHVLMMAAVQPFLSGAISKTVNLPEHASIQDVADIYFEAWRLGLKAIAIYRDGCKQSQPLTTKLESKKTDEPIGPSIPVANFKPLTLEDLIEAARGMNANDELGKKLGMVKRRRLPPERAAVTHKFSVSSHEGYLTVGLFEDGTPGELFCTMAKEGSTISGLMDVFATAISLALQYGVPLRVLVEKFAHTRFEPSGFTKNQDIPMASSVSDYIFRWLGKKFLHGAERPDWLNANQSELFTDEQVHKKGETASTTHLARTAQMGTNLFQQDAPPCQYCGNIMIRNGACYRCANCGSTSGCS